MINKNWTLALSLLTLSTAFVAADQNSKMNTNQSQPMPMGVTSQPTGVITPPVAPIVRDSADFFTEADFIYWNVQEGGLVYSKTTEVGDGTQKTIRSGSVQQASRKWEPGFKLGAGLAFQHDGWDLFANWTWLNPVTHDSSSVGTYRNQTQLRSILVPDDLTPDLSNQSSVVNSAQGTWTLHFNTLDLELGRNFFFSRYLTFRPHFGLKSAWINQSFNRSYGIDGSVTINYNGNHVEVNGLTIDYVRNLESNQTANTWGLGIRAGLQPVWHFSRSWGIYGNFAMSAMYTNVKSSSKLEILREVGDKRTITNYTKSNHTVLPVLELGLGLQYQTWFYNEAYMLQLNAGWEEQVWFRANQFINTAQNGNLSLQGFTFNVGFHF